MKDVQSLSVAEHFLSIQGEGQTAGRPAYFLRLAGCNLLCGGKKQLENGAAWVCDSIEVWMKGTRVNFPDLVEKMGGETFINDLQNKHVHLIVTGGEPLLQDEALANFLTYIQIRFGFLPIIEIETNGTIIPTLNLIRLVAYWNVSPKLSNSGEPGAKRINVEFIHKFSAMGPRTMFKFVIANTERDWEEIEADYLPYIKDRRQIWLMPAASSQDELNLVSEFVGNLCIDERINMSTRLQLVNWNQTTGV